MSRPLWSAPRPALNLLSWAIVSFRLENTLVGFYELAVAGLPVEQLRIEINAGVH